MVDVAAREAPSQPNAKTVQEYIDELPIWPDGTSLKSTPMTGMQWRIWTLAAFGKFFEGFVVFMGGVSLPLITREFHLAEAEKGLVTSASLAGILVGTILLGGLSDYFGRKRMFIAEMIIFCMFLTLLILVGNFVSLVICLFGIGMALGCDYPTAHMIISENIPSASRGRLVLGAFAFQAIGAMSGIIVGALVLVIDPSIDAWRWMYATALAPAILITVGRFFITESANWLIVRGQHEKAEQAVSRLLYRTPVYPQKVALARHVVDEASASKQTFFALFNAKNLRATIFSSAPWLFQDLGTYGIGVFTPTLIAAALGSGPDKIRSPADLIASGIHSAEAAALTTSLLIVGIVFAIWLSDSLGRIRLQVFGFLGCAVGLVIASLSIDASEALKAGPHHGRRDAVQLHDQSRPQRANLPARGRGVPDGSARHGRRLRGDDRQGRRSRHHVRLPAPARQHRHAFAALRPRRQLGARRRRDLDVPHRNHRREPRSHRPLSRQEQETQS